MSEFILAAALHGKTIQSVEFNIWSHQLRGISKLVFTDGTKLEFQLEERKGFRWLNGKFEWSDKDPAPFDFLTE